MTGADPGQGRPDPPPAPEGFKAVPAEDAGWVIRGGRHCRRQHTPRQPACGRPGVAAVWRGERQPMLWDYCERHLYGRWVEGGKVWHWILAPL